MKEEYKRMIAEMDKTLSMLRESWMAAVMEEKPRWLDRLNAMLDERFRLMKLRDGAPNQLSPAPVS